MTSIECVAPTQRINMTIELAPNNKQGLALPSPLIAGSSAVGYGDAWPPGLTPAHFGAIVTSPISRLPGRGAPQPRLAELPGGFVLATGDHNPGIKRVLRDHGERWTKLDLPVLVALAASTPEDWPALAERLEETPGVAGIELQIAEHADWGTVEHALTATRRATTLPMLSKIPVVWAELLAEICAHAGMDALVVGTAPIGTYPTPSRELVEGPVAGPAAFPFTLRALRAVARLDLRLPLIAAGGIHRPRDVRLCLDAGATAVQVRSLLWVDPVAVGELVAMFSADK